MNRYDFELIASWIPERARVLDLGCGDGVLLAGLSATHGVTGYGVEIDDAGVLASVRNGVNVIQMDMETGLSTFEDSAFDFVILSQTLQAMRDVEGVMNEMLRVGREGIVTFPNFGYWRHRLDVFLGHMPVSRTLPHNWYDTPNIHLCTVKDFEDLCVKLDAEILDERVINEGGTGAQEVLGVRRPVFHVGVAEKGPLWLRLVTTGTPGHGSVPHDDNALERLICALERIRRWERPQYMTPEVNAYFEALHRAGILTGAPTGEQLQALASQHPRIHSLQTNSISVTSLHAGVKHNVIPAHAEATIDVRLVTGYDPARFLNELRTVIDDPQIEVETVFSSSTPSSPTGTELFRAIQKAVRDHVEDAVVVPSVSTGFTDLRVFRRKGIPAYGFVPVLLEPEDAGRTHGNDERIAIESIRLAMQILFATVREVCE